MPELSTDPRRYLPAMGRASLLPLYDPVARLLGARDAQWRLVAQAGIAPGHTVLEIGAGTGAVLLLAKRAVPSATVIGLDPDADALAYARRKAVRQHLELGLDQGFADGLPYAGGRFDRVLSAFMFHHVSSAEKLPALREVHRVLAPGGSLHLLDFGGTTSGPFGRLLHRRHTHGHEGAASEGRAPTPEFLPSDAVLALMRQAGLVEPTVVGHRSSLLGPMTFYRASA